VKQSPKNPLILNLATDSKGGLLPMDPTVKRFNTTSAGISIPGTNAEFPLDDAQSPGRSRNGDSSSKKKKGIEK
jgi:hypothetical protein